MKKIFLNSLDGGYDLDIAEKFYHGFKAISGVSVWWRPKSCSPGQNVKKTIKKEINNSDFFLSLNSGQSASSGMHIYEQNEALEKMKEFPYGEIFIIPMWIGDPANFKKYEKQFPTSHLKSFVLFPDWQETLASLFRLIGLTIPNMTVNKRIA